MRRWMAVFVACLLLLGLAACGEDGRSTADDYALNEANAVLAAEVVAAADGYLDGANRAAAALAAVEDLARGLDREGGGRDGRLELETHLVALQRALTEDDAAAVRKARNDLARLADLPEISADPEDFSTGDVSQRQ